MLSSISQFISIPSPFSSNHPPPPEISSTSAADDDSTATSEHNVVHREPQQMKKRERKTIYETFIVVRPPPSKSNHPLNLQVQLVPLSSSSNNKNESTDTVNSTTGVPLTRTISNRSNRSSTSLYSTSNSLSSVSSLASNASSTRRIIPLYNLSAHNVLTNTVTDAGTDAKVAKFAKRGIEIVGLGTLEGYEIRHVSSLDAVPSSSSSLRPSSVIEEGGRLSPLKRNQSPSKSPSVISHASNASNNIVTPSSSNTHLSSSEDPATPTQQFVTQSSTPKDQGSAKKLFGKIFKKKGTDASPSSSPQPGTPTTPSSIFSRNSATPKSSTRLSFFSSPTPTTATAPTFPRLSEQSEDYGIQTPPSSAFLSLSPSTPTPAQTQQQSSELCGSLQPPVLGTQASLLYRAPPQAHSRVPSGGNQGPISGAPIEESIDITTPHGAKFNFTPPHGYGHHSYEWVIRKWVKKRDTPLPGGPTSEEVGLVGGLVAGVGTSLSTVMQNVNGGSFDGAGIEVRFEWVRGKGSKARAKEKERRQRRKEGTSAWDISRPSSVYGSVVVSDPNGASVPVRPSMDSRSSSHSDGGSKDVHTRRRTNGTAESAAAPTSVDEHDEGDESDPEDSDTPWSCTLWVGPASANPDEPSSAAGGLKLKLGNLTPAPHHPKVVCQFKMPFPLPDVDVEKCELVWDRVNGEETDLERGMMLSAEEIKDVVSVTGLWLIVREGFGGLERRRKGDGWKIRG